VIIGKCRSSDEPEGNIKPARDKSSEKIDGIVALTMAVGRWMEKEEQGDWVIV
jgi:phage terminase large subunit-like protein